MTVSGRTLARARRNDGGFGLIELLAGISILGIIGFGLTEAVIAGFKTTDGTVSRSGNSVTTQLLNRYFARDAQNASQVSATDDSCAPSGDPVVIRLGWSEPTRTDTASYLLKGTDPEKPGEQDLVRWSCTTQGSVVTKDQRLLGHFSVPAGNAISATCDGAPCPATLDDFDEVTLSVHTGSPAPDNLTVRRRTS